MSVSLIQLIYLITGLILGAAAAWIGSRPVLARLRSQLESDRALQAERLKTYADAEGRFRDAFASLSAQALNKNNETFLHLAETRLKQARTEATADIDARKKAIDELLAPMAKTLERVDHEIQDAERRRVQDGASLLQRVASLDAIGKDLQAETRRLVDALKRPGVRGRWGELRLKRVVELAGMIEHCDFDEQQTIDGSVQTSSSVCPAANTWSSMPKCRSMPICARSKRLMKQRARRFSSNT